MEISIETMALPILIVSFAISLVVFMIINGKASAKAKEQGGKDPETIVGKGAPRTMYYVYMTLVLWACLSLFIPSLLSIKGELVHSLSLWKKFVIAFGGTCTVFIFLLLLRYSVSKGVLNWIYKSYWPRDD